MIYFNVRSALSEASEYVINLLLYFTSFHYCVHFESLQTFTYLSRLPRRATQFPQPSLWVFLPLSFEHYTILVTFLAFSLVITKDMRNGEFARHVFALTHECPVEV